MLFQEAGMNMDYVGSLPDFTLDGHHAWKKLASAVEGRRQERAAVLVSAREAARRKEQNVLQASAGSSAGPAADPAGSSAGKAEQLVPEVSVIEAAEVIDAIMSKRLKLILETISERDVSCCFPMASRCHPQRPQRDTVASRCFLVPSRCLPSRPEIYKHRCFPLL